MLLDLQLIGKSSEPIMTNLFLRYVNHNIATAMSFCLTLLVNYEITIHDKQTLVVKDCFVQEPGTKNWRFGSQDIHLYQDMMNPHLMKMYPQTKVVCTSNIFVLTLKLSASENPVASYCCQGRG